LVLTAALLFLVVGVIYCSMFKAKAEFAAPPMSIPGKSFGWNICVANAATQQMSCASNDLNSTNANAKLPPIVIGSGEDVNFTAKAVQPGHPPAKAGTQGNVTITVFGQ
jgi:hypothetical protein